jgi:hypothetical protein
MLNKFIRGLLSVIGIVVGYLITNIVVKLNFMSGLIKPGHFSVSLLISYAIGMILFGIIFFVISPFIINIVWKAVGMMENWLQKIPTNEIIIGGSGLIIGLIVANLLVGAFTKLLSTDDVLSVIGGIISIIVNNIFGTLGLNIAIKKRDDLSNIFSFLKRFGKDKKGKGDGKPYGCIPYRLINMYSVKGDTVLDPFVGTGTTMLAALSSERNSIGTEIDFSLCENMFNDIVKIKKQLNKYIENRLQKHLEFIEEQKSIGKDKFYKNKNHGFEVKTQQEIEACFNIIEEINLNNLSLNCTYEKHSKVD